MRLRWLALGIGLAVAAGLALRLPQLDRRPLHNDECVNALKLQALWEQGHYQYDPAEFHGPTLYYLSLPFLWLSGAPDFQQLTDQALRWAPVAFGVGLIGLVWLLRTGLGSGATVCAAWLTALSPAMVFYSRYLIHEMLLIFFTLLWLGAGWRYYQTRRIGWALTAGAALGLMYATKETFVFNVAALVIAAGLALAWTRWWEGARAAPLIRLNSTHVLAAGAAAIAVAGLLFSSFFTNPRGPVDAIRTYAIWFNRAGGQEGHRHPWHFYLERLFWFKRPRGPVWTEGLILALAVVGGTSALVRRRRVTPDASAQAGSVAGASDTAGTWPSTESQSAQPSPANAQSERGSAMRATAPASALGPYSVGLARLLAFYALALTAIYSLIPYKTPWCALGFLHPLILLAGVGAVELVRACQARWVQCALAAVLLAAAGHLTWQAWRASYPMAADRRNPYVYAQTVPNLLELAEKVKAIAAAAPEGRNTLVKVAAEESRYLPLPWYLRQLTRVWWTDSPAPPYAPIMVVSASFRANLDEITNKRWLMVGLFEMRPAVFFELYVEFELWKRYLATLPRPVEP